MICVSLGAGNFASLRRVLAKVPFAEIRLDRVTLTVDEVGRLFSLPRALVATCRPGRTSEKTREMLLREAIASGASYVDIELETSDGMRRRLIREARSRGCKVMISYHNFRQTPSESVLSRKVAACYGRGGDIAKIACRVRTDSDVRRLLSLYDLAKGRRSLLALGMGKRGTITRIAAPILGAPFTYAAADGSAPTAPGQLDRKTMESIYRLIGGAGR